MASCTGTVPNGQPLDTTPGTHTFTVTAIDNAGNTTTVTHSYRASICSRTGAHAVSCELWARAGTIDLPGMRNVPDQDVRRPQRCAGDHAGRRPHPRRARRRHRQHPVAQRPGRAARARRAAAADGSCDLQDRTRRIRDVLLRRAHGHVDLRGRLGSERRGARRERRQAGRRRASTARSSCDLRRRHARPTARPPRVTTRRRSCSSRTSTRRSTRIPTRSTCRCSRRRTRSSTAVPTTERRAARCRSSRRQATTCCCASSTPRCSFHPIGLLGLRESVVGESSHALRYPRSADRYDGRPWQHGRRDRAPAVGSVGGRALRALRHEPPPLQRHPGRLWRNAHHDRRDRHVDDILRRARHLPRAGPGHHRRDRGSRVQRVRHSLRRGTGDDRHGGRVLRRHRRRRRIGQRNRTRPEPSQRERPPGRRSLACPKAGTRSTCTAATRPAPGARSRATPSSSLGSARR